jgi:hypothetical protein
MYAAEQRIRREDVALGAQDSAASIRTRTNLRDMPMMPMNATLRALQGRLVEVNSEAE